MAKDQICRMNVDKKKSKQISEVNGCKVYQCSSNCKDKFDQYPRKYGY